VIPAIRTGRRKNSEKGSAAIEFALGAMVMVYAFTGIFQYGYSFYQYSLLETAVHEAAIYAGQEAFPSTAASGSNISSCYATRIKNMAIYGNPNGGSKALLPGLGTNNIVVNMAATSGTPSQVTVAISNFTLNGVLGSTALTNKPQATMPYTGRWATAGDPAATACP
jgi:Flp pilus assembly protein TadG